MNKFSRTVAIAALCSTTALTSLFAHTAHAQSNNSPAPLLPPPPTAALEPIPTPTAATPAVTPTANMNGGNVTAPREIGIAGLSPSPAPTSATPAATQTTAAPVAAPTNNPAAVPVTNTTPVPSATAPTPTAQSMGASTADVAAPTSTSPIPSTPALPPPASELAVAPIALPGMPRTEAGLTATQNGATTTIDPSLVGGDNNQQGYDQAAYEERLKQRMEEIKAETRQKAMEQATDNVFPLQPTEIEALLQQLRLTQAAVQKPIERPPATPRAVVHTMELDPGAQPPTVQLLNGNVTSLSILDATGQPWPIVDIAFGGPFDVKPPEAGGHIIRISPLKEYAHGNMSVRLQKLPTPLTFTLEAGGQEVHYRFDARIPKLGPNAKTSLIDRGLTITAGEDSSLSAILVGTPPASAERLKVIGVDGRTSAYRLDGATYVRTPHTLLSPTWQSSVSSADGTNVYKLNDAPVLLLSDEGTMVRAQIQQPVIDPFALPADQRAVPDASSAQTTAGVRG